MPEFPNLDYDPGPAQASYSRVGPQPGRAGAERQPRLEPAPAVQVVHHEMAEELGVRPQAARRRRHNRRKYRYVR